MSAGNNPAEVERLTKAFQEIDKDHNGYIDIKELETAFCSAFKASGRPADEAEIKRACANIMKGLDTDKDNKVTLKEYLEYYTNLNLY